MNYLLTVVTLGMVYLIAALAVEMLASELRLLSVAHATLMGLAAYASAIFETRFGWPVVLACLIGVMFAGGASLLVASISVWIKDEYFIMVLIAFALVISGLMENVVSLTGGDSGIVGIVPWTIPGLTVNASCLVITTVLAILTILTRHLFRRSPLGRTWRALGDSASLATSLGVNPRLARTSAFLVSGIIAGVAGVAYAHFVAFVDPSAFTIHESIFILSLVIIGGLGSVVGVIAGTAFGVALPEILRMANLSGPNAGILQQMIFGLVLVAVIVLRPRGILGLGISLERRGGSL